MQNEGYRSFFHGVGREVWRGVGAAVEAQLVEPLYASDQQVGPAGAWIDGELAGSRRFASRDA